MKLLSEFAAAVVLSQALFFAGWMAWHRSRRRSDAAQRFSRGLLERLRGTARRNPLQSPAVPVESFFLRSDIHPKCETARERASRETLIDKAACALHGGNAHQRRIQRRHEARIGIRAA